MATATTTASGGSWSTSSLSKALPSGKATFKAYATEVSSLGNAEGTSSTVSFEVDTLPPQVTITAPPSPSKNTEPSFSGTASEDTQVVVHVFEGASEVANASTTASGGKWSTSGLSKALPAGKATFKAYATEVSGLGNAEGTSSTVSFEVDTLPPEVTIIGPPSPSKNTEPAFSGAASEDTKVEVHVFEGSTEVAHASTTAAGGTWSTSGLSKALPSGKAKFKAYATEVSGLGNAEGRSSEVSFEVDTLAPEVAITGSPARSNNLNPGFSGTASEPTQVVVHVFEGTTEVASASTTASGGAWSTSGLSKALPAGNHTFKAYATEVSGLGNAEGKSSTVNVEVDTLPPEVTIVTPISPSRNQSPGISGTASENGQVVVHVFEGASEVSNASTTASGGKWSTSSLSKALPVGKHTFKAYATETSGLGNGEGRSSEVSFEVDTSPPEVTLVEPGPTKSTQPGFSGTASENTEVVVHVFEGATEVATATTTASGGKWSTSGLSKPLPTGKHSFTAYATEKSGLGNEPGTSAPVVFEVDTDSPEVTLVGPSAPSNDLEPGFAGTASEPTQIVVHVFEGTTEVASASTTASGGKWSTSGLSKALPAGRHTFKAYATEVSGLGNAEGRSNEASFEVDTLPPEVGIAAPPSRSRNTEPGFSGTASEATEVEVHVFEGSTEVATATTTASGGKWSTSTLSKALPAGSHPFKAYATEKSGLGNEPGKSTTVSFEVDTLPPEVTIVAPPSRSPNRNPGFSGTASEDTEVEVHVMEGTTQVATATTTALDGKWSTSGLSKELPAGKHTFEAFATEVSGLGNAEGKSEEVPFEVDTLPPEVSIVGPPSPSKSTEPAFSGAASENTEVEVRVFEGSTKVATATATASGGKWSTSSLSKALPSGKHIFTAYATEISGLGNEPGKSNEVGFEVNTQPPEPTLVAPPSPSNNVNPGFSGTASEATPVTVHVFEGTTEVASASTTASGGTWSTSGLNKALPSGKHTFKAYATEVSGLGNAEGRSNEVSFEVDTLPPEVSIVAPTSPSKNVEPGFSGTASEATQVTVHVFEGTTEVSSASTTASGGKWSTTTLSKALPSGKHKFTAYAMEVSGLGNAEGKSNEVGFEVNTLPPEVVIFPRRRRRRTTRNLSSPGRRAKQQKSSCMSLKEPRKCRARRLRHRVGNGRPPR